MKCSNLRNHTDNNSLTVWLREFVGDGTAAGQCPAMSDIPSLLQSGNCRRQAVFFPIIAKRSLALKPHFIDLLVGKRVESLCVAKRKES